MTIRSFIGIPLQNQTIDKLEQFTAFWRGLDKHTSIRWIEKENIHLTLCFLGESEPAQLKILSESIQSKISKITPFCIHLSEITRFPFNKKPRLVVSMVKANNMLALCKNRIDDCARAHGFSLEKRKFRPHITLGRLKKSWPPKLQVPPFTVQISFQVNKIIIYQSHLNPQGAKYFPLHEIGLENEDLI